MLPVRIPPQEENTTNSNIGCQARGGFLYPLGHKLGQDEAHRLHKFSLLCRIRSHDAQGPTEKQPVRIRDAIFNGGLDSDNWKLLSFCTHINFICDSNASKVKDYYCHNIRSTSNATGARMWSRTVITVFGQKPKIMKAQNSLK